LFNEEEKKTAQEIYDKEKMIAHQIAVQSWGQRGFFNKELILAFEYDERLRSREFGDIPILRILCESTMRHNV
jgi:hypothetical protein